jgi:hypothetical protein
VKANFPLEFRSSETVDLFTALIMYRLKMNGHVAVIIPEGFLFGGGTKAAIKKKMFTEFNLHTVIRMPQNVFAPYTDIATNILFFDKTNKTKETWFYHLDMPNGVKHFSKTKPMKLEHFTLAIEWWNNRKQINEDGFDKARCYTAHELAYRDYNLDLCGYPHEEEEILPPHELLSQFHNKRTALNSSIDRIFSNIGSMLEGEIRRTTQHLDKSMQELATLSISFPARLRKAILKAAVQGKLIPRDQQAETADINEYEGDTPYDLPEGRRWVHLDDLCVYIQRGKSHKYNLTKQIPIIAKSAINGQASVLTRLNLSNRTHYRHTSRNVCYKKMTLCGIQSGLERLVGWQFI